MPAQTLILGAGPAGLTAAVALQRARHDVLLVERAARVGGLTRTEVRDGFRFDLGGHRFYTRKQEVHDFVAGLLGDDLLLVPRRSTIHFRGRFVDYPLRPWNALRNVGPSTALAIGRDLLGLGLRRRPSSPPRSLADWMLQSYGKTLFETYFRVYAEKVWGMPAHHIDAGLAAQRVKGLDLWATLRNMVRPRSAGAKESMVERFHYPRLGFGMICEAMARELGPQRIHLDTEPIRLRHDGGMVRSVDLRHGDGTVRHTPVEQVISSIPLPALVRLCDPAPPAAVQQACDALSFRAVVFVAVFLACPSVRPESWIYFPSPEISFGRITEPRNWSAQMAPPGMTSLVAEHFCDPGDPVWRTDDAVLLARTIDDLVKLGFIRRDQVVGSAVVRAPGAYPRMDVDHHRHVAAVDAWLSGLRNLQAIGRAGLYRYHNTDHVIETGLAAASNLLGGSVDVRAINSELAYHEEKASA